VRDGSGALSLQGIADEAEVSKALLLYHFRDKDDILATLITWVSGRVVAREARALEGSTPATLLEALWKWLHHEIQEGEFRVLVELAGERGPRTRQANSGGAAPSGCRADDDAGVPASAPVAPRPHPDACGRGARRP
jgi:AcrR family transcriptional regulator